MHDALPGCHNWNWNRYLSNPIPIFFGRAPSNPIPIRFQLECRPKLTNVNWNSNLKLRVQFEILFIEIQSRPNWIPILQLLQLESPKIWRVRPIRFQFGTEPNWNSFGIRLDGIPKFSAIPIGIAGILESNLVSIGLQ